MSGREAAVRGGVGALLRWGLRLAVSLWIVAIFFHDPGVTGYARAEFGELVAGTAWRPFVTRALFPALVRVGALAIPPGAEAALRESALGRRVAAELNLAPALLGEFAVAFALTLACVVLLSLVMQRLWEASYRGATGGGYAFSILGLLGIPAFFVYYSYLYDLPFLLLYTACLLMLARRRWRAYLALFALAALSKETAALLILVFGLYFIRSAREERRTYWRFVTLQVLILAVARGSLLWVFRDNPGSSLEVHLLDHNLDLLTRPWSMGSVVTWGAIAVLAFADIGSKPYLLRVAAAMLLPLVAACLLFGFVDELRDYYEVYVPVALLVGHTLGRLLGGPIETIAPRDAAAVGPLRGDAHYSP